MNLSAPFIKRPVATALMAAALLAVGVISFFQLPVSAIPQVDFPTLQVSAALPGASPETMASNVATPLERQFSQIPGLTQLTSSSSLGQSQVVLQFDLNRSIDGAAQDVQAAINAAAGQLPTNLPAPPQAKKVNPADSPILVLMGTSDTLPISTVSDYLDSIVAQQISRIDGVGLVKVNGQRKPAFRIQIDPRRAAAHGVQLDAIRQAITANTVNAPKGQLTGAASDRTIYANDQALDAKTWNDMIVAYHDGAPLRVSDIGKATLDVENDQSGASFYPGKAYTGTTTKGGPAIILGVVKQPGSNVISTVEAIKKQLPQIMASLPPGIKVEVVQDKTQTIRASVHDVEITLLITVFLVVGVIFLFLRNVAATLIPSAVIPISLFAATAVMLPLGFSLDNLSLMAMTIAVGFVVDDAIVMVEAIWRRIEHGENPRDAALAGAGEIGFTILSIAISLVAVFTPLMFMGGVVGKLMREFALTLSFAVAISVTLSLTFTPMLCARFLRAPKPARSPFMRALEGGFHSLEQRYARGLDVVMHHKRIVIVTFIAFVALAGVMYATAETGFFPQQDIGVIQFTMVTAQNASYPDSIGKAQAVSKVMTQDPDVYEAHFNIGNDSGNVSQITGSMTLREPSAGRTSTPAQIMARLRPKLAQLVGVQTFMAPQQDIQIGGRAGRAQYQYTLSDVDIDELNTWAPRITQALQAIPQLTDVSSDLQSSAAAATLVIDRNAAGRFGIAPADIDAALYNQVGQRQVAQYFTQLNSYHVVLEGVPELQGDNRLFDSIFINSPRTGKPVPLSLLVKVDDRQTRPITVNHQSQLPATTITFNVAPGVSLGEATQLIEKAKEEVGAPASLSSSFQGVAAAFQQSLSTMPILIVAALLSVYVILGVLYESFIHPLTILSTLPSAGVGALLALRIGGHDLDVIGIVAIVLLIGIVKKNGIMIVDVALKLERESGMDAEEAVVAASRQRLRPILMTTACAFLGGMPMILGHGTGSEFRQPLGWAICGGLLVSQLLTLFTTPVVYYYLDKVRQRFEHGAEPAPALARDGLVGRQLRAGE